MEQLNGWVALAWPYIMNVIFAVLILGIGWIIANWLKRKIRKWGEASDTLDDTLTRLFAKIGKSLIMVVVIMAVLGRFGVQIASLVAIIGALGLAIGMAWQGVLADFAAGIMILVMRPFSVGDAVDIGGTSGNVEEIGLVLTKINTFDNVAIFLPNSNVWGNNIKNMAENDVRRVDLVVGFGYDDDIDLAKETLQQIFAEHDLVLEDPSPQVAVSELGGSSVNVVARPWVKAENYWGVMFELKERIKKQFDEEGINFPYPSQDIYFHNDDD